MTSTVSVPPSAVPQPSAQPRAAQGRGSLLSALCKAAVLVGVLIAATWMSGAVAEHDLPWVGYGAVLALLGAALALLVHRRIFDARASQQLGDNAKLQSMRLQGLLGLGFGIKITLVVIAVLVLRGNDVKFPQLAAFAVAFAGASLVAQLVLASALVRSASTSPRSPSS